MFELFAHDSIGIVATCEVATLEDVQERVSDVLRANAFLRENGADEQLLITHVNVYGDDYADVINTL